MLLLADVDDDVLGARVFADDLSFIHLDAGADEQSAAILCVEQAIGARLAGFVGDKASGLALEDFALKRLIARENVVHDAVAARVGHQLGTIAHQAARRDHELQARAGVADRGHIDHFGLALPELFHDGADVFLRYVDGQFLHRLADAALLVAPENDLRAGHRKLIALPAHLLDQNGEVQLAAARDAERIGGIGLLDAHGHVRFDLGEQALAQVAARDILALLARKRTVVDKEQHVHGRLVDLHKRHRLDQLRGARGFADVQILDARNADDIARIGDLGFHALQALEIVEPRDLRFARAVVLSAAEHDRHTAPRGAALDAADTDLADVVVVVDCGEQDLQGRVVVLIRRGDLLYDRVKDGLHIVLHLVRLIARLAVARGGIDDREVQLLLACAELDEQLQRFVHDLIGTRLGAIHLIDDDDALFIEFQSLAEHEPRLRHTALERVDQKQNAVHHLQNTLDLAAEVRVTRRVHDVDARIAVDDRGVLGQDRDAALALQIAGVHDAVGALLAAPKRARVLQKLIDQRCLAVIDVRDDSHIANVHKKPSLIRNFDRNIIHRRAPSCKSNAPKTGRICEVFTEMQPLAVL